MNSSNTDITPGARQYSIHTRNQNTVLTESLHNAIERHDQEREHRERQTLEWNRWLGNDEEQRYFHSYSPVIRLQVLFPTQGFKAHVCSCSDLVLQRLQDKRKELVEAWQNFQSGNSLIALRQAPTIDELREAVSNAQLARENQRKGMTYTAKSRFMDFLDTMNDHSFLFEFIPVGDKYVSLITGVITSIVKVRITKTSCSTTNDIK